MALTNKKDPSCGIARAIAMASALCCATLAHAQTGEGVTLYGLADAGITSTSGLKGGTVTQVASGIMEGSRWGIKGNEDLGGGYKAIFTLEARVELDTGANSSTPISGGQLSDRYSNAALLGLPAWAARCVCAPPSTDNATGFGSFGSKFGRPKIWCECGPLRQQGI